MLHASFRTQNRDLLSESEQFFRCWSRLEIAAGYVDPDDAQTVNGSWDRKFRIRGTENRSNSEIGEAIGQYIKRVDSALKSYFAALPDRNAAQKSVADYFR